MKRSRNLQFDCLDAIISLSALHLTPLHNKPAMAYNPISYAGPADERLVHDSLVKPPHEEGGGR